MLLGSLKQGKHQKESKRTFYAKKNLCLDAWIFQGMRHLLREEHVKFTVANNAKYPQTSRWNTECFCAMWRAVIHQNDITEAKKMRANLWGLHFQANQSFSLFLSSHMSSLIFKSFKIIDNLSITFFLLLSAFVFYSFILSLIDLDLCLYHVCPVCHSKDLMRSQKRCDSFHLGACHLLGDINITWMLTKNHQVTTYDKCDKLVIF